MWKAFINCWKVPEVRKRILFTIGILVLCRLAANVPCPGIDMKALDELFTEVTNKSGGAGDIGNMLNLFTGGGLQKFGVAALGIMPYITASIIMSLIGPVVPAIEKWKREGETGHQKMTQWTRYLTLLICLVQGTMMASGMAYPAQNPLFSGVAQPGDSLLASGISPQMFIILSVVVLMCGTMLLMWLGEQITEKGLGQGASLIITIGILARLPDALMNLWNRVISDDAESMYVVEGLIYIAIFCVITAAVVALTLGVRKVPVQYARARAGRSGGIQGGGGQGTFFPLRVNHAGVMPIIFASTLLMVPGLLFQQIPGMNVPDWLKNGVAYIAPFFSPASQSYMLVYAALIMFFCFFWVSSQFNPVKVADDLKRSSAYVPGYRPGQDTADYLNWTMTRVTTAGAIFLTIVALIPMIFVNVTQNQQDYLIAQFFGGTSMLIMVGVMLDTIRQLETYMLSHGGYETFMKKGRMRGRQNGLPGVSSQ